MCIPGEAHPHSPGMEMRLTGNAYPHRKWECASPGIQILSGNGGVPQREWGCASAGRGWASPGMHILTGNAHR